MDCKTLTKIKAGLLCQGVNVDEDVGKELLKARPYFYDKGFVHAVNTKIFGSNVCVSVAEKFTGVPGVYVSLEETLRGFKAILNGEMDEYPEAAFFNVGTIDDVKRKASEM